MYIRGQAEAPGILSPHLDPCHTCREQSEAQRALTQG